MKKLLSIAFAFSAFAAQADEMRILSAASMQTVLKEVVPQFERDTGHKLAIRYSTMGAITDRVMGGEQADLVISSGASIATLVKAGRIDPASEVRVARTAVGMVVSAATPKPTVESVEDFRRALLDAKTVVYANPAGGGAAGIHIARVIAKLGIAEQIQPKLKLGAGGDVAELTVSLGEGALGLTQVTEIVGKPGMQFIPVPEELQNYTGFVAGIPAGAKPSQVAVEFVRFLGTPAVAAVMKTNGMEK